MSADPIALKGQEPIVEHALILIQFASDITALAAAMTTLADAALHHRGNHGKND